MLHTVTTECYWLLLTATDCYWVSATEWVLLSATECYYWVLLSATECYWASATECYWVQLSATRNKSLSAFFEVYFSEWGSPLFVIGSVWIRPFKRLYIDIALTRNAGVLSPCTKPAHIPLSRTNQNDSPQQWKTKLNCCRMGFCFGSALLLARWLRKYRFKGFWRIYSPLLENKNSGPCLALLDTLSSWPSRPCFWSQHRFLVLVRIKLRHMPLDGYREGSQKSQNSLGLLATPHRVRVTVLNPWFSSSLIHTVATVRTTHCVLLSIHIVAIARATHCVLQTIESDKIKHRIFIASQVACVGPGTTDVHSEGMTQSATGDCRESLRGRDGHQHQWLTAGEPAHRLDRCTQKNHRAYWRRTKAPLSKCCAHSSQSQLIYQRLQQDLDGVSLSAVEWSCLRTLFL